MKKIHSLLVALALAGCCRQTPADALDTLLPAPAHAVRESGAYTLPEKLVVAYSDRTLLPAGDFLSRSLPAEVRIKTSSDPDRGNLILALDSSLDTIGGYRLTVSRRGIRIDAGSYGGAIAGIATLRQLSDGRRCIPAVTIEDSPRFAWRGFMLDVARHFFSKEEVMALLDKAAQYKLNKFHWHLTDDQGWRVEIRSHPELTARGAWRDPSAHNNDRTCLERAAAQGDSTMLLPRKFLREVDGQTLYGGCYTQDDIREVVAYAASLGIDVIPEVDMPGHSLQVVAAHPELSCTGRAEWGETFSTPLCLGNDATLAFCREVYGELFDLFPFGYFHLGADEVEKHNWERCPKCQHRIASLGLGDEHGLQGWFVHEMEEYFAQHGRRLIGWDEIVSEGMPQCDVVQWWRNWMPSSLRTAAANGNDIIINTGEFFYLDGQQNRNSLSKVYGFDPTRILPDEHLGQVLGIHANLWTEFVPSFDRACFQIFPRLFAACEIMWSPLERRNAENFPARAAAQLQRLDAEGWNYRIPDLEGVCDRNVFTDSTAVTIRKPFDAIEVYYTLDGSLPDRRAARYDRPIPITEDCTLRLRAYTSSGKGGEVVTAEFRRMEPLAAAAASSDRREGLTARWYDYRGEACTEIESAPLRGTYEGIPVVIPEGVAGNIGLIFNGYFEAPEEGIYSFYSYSDDGSTITIDGIPVVDNDGPHPREERTGQIALCRGPHAIEVRYFDSNGGMLEAGLIGADGVRTPFTPDLFSHE